MRPAAEEFNLAGKQHRQDVTAAEFIRTFRSRSFLGCALLSRFKFEAEGQLQERRQVSTVPVRRSSTRQQSSFSVPLEEVYGFRGREPALYYLSPWELQVLWHDVVSRLVFEERRRRRLLEKWNQLRLGMQLE